MYFFIFLNIKLLNSCQREGISITASEVSFVSIWVFFQSALLLNSYPLSCQSPQFLRTWPHTALASLNIASCFCCVLFSLLCVCGMTFPIDTLFCMAKQIMLRFWTSTCLESLNLLPVGSGAAYHIPLVKCVVGFNQLIADQFNAFDLPSAIYEPFLMCFFIKQHIIISYLSSVNCQLHNT